MELDFKDGFGGLCDFNMLGWMVLCVFGVCDLEVLVGLGYLGVDEVVVLKCECVVLVWLCFGLYLVVCCLEECLCFDY